MLFRIFNGTSRGLGEGGKGRDIYAQIGVEFRDHLKHFKGAKFGVFMCLLLHSDEGGWSFPGIERIADETGYSLSEVKETITELCRLEIDGQRVLFAMQVKEQGRFKHNKYLVFPTAEEIERYAAYERRPRKKAGKQGTPPRPGFPATEKQRPENWPLSKTTLKQNHSKKTHPVSSSFVAVAAGQATAAHNAAADMVIEKEVTVPPEPDTDASDVNTKAEAFQAQQYKSKTPLAQPTTHPATTEINKPRLELAPELLKEAHGLLRDFYGVTYKASRDRIITNLASRPDLMLRVIRQYGDEIQANHRLDDHYNCAGALVRVLCDLDMRMFVTGMTGST